MALNFANNNSLSAITTKPSGLSGGALNLISTQTASGSATIDFTSGIDSTYPIYIFKFINIHVATDDAVFRVNFRDGGSNYDATKTTSFFRAYHAEDASAATLTYATSHDLAQSTSAQDIITSNGSGNDESASGTLTLYNPSSTTFVKHFMSDCNVYHGGNLAQRLLVGGYCNVTAAIDGVQFAMSSGNIDSGVIKLYGIS